MPGCKGPAYPKPPVPAVSKLLLSLGEDATVESAVVASFQPTGRDDLATLIILGLVRSDGTTCMANLDAIRVWPGPR